jgi:cytochrome b561
LIALLILALGVVGLTMGELPKTPSTSGSTPRTSRSASPCWRWCCCVGWRLYAGAPKPVPGVPSWQERIASATHVLLYVLMFAIPLSGWLYDSASGLRPFRWFGLVDVPKLSGQTWSLPSPTPSTNTASGC